MTRRPRDLPETRPMRERARLPDRGGGPPREDEVADAEEQSTELGHEALVAALRAIEGLVDVGHDPPDFHFRGRPFLHFHESDDGTYADVRFGGADFEPVWASTPRERAELLARVSEHIERLERVSKSGRPRPARRREPRARH